MEVSKHILPEKLVAGILNITDFHILNDREKIDINGINYTFFDINARGTKQFGFECMIDEKN